MLFDSRNNKICRLNKPTAVEKSLWTAFKFYSIPIIGITYMPFVSLRVLKGLPVSDVWFLCRNGPSSCWNVQLAGLRWTQQSMCSMWANVGDCTQTNCIWRLMADSCNAVHHKYSTWSVQKCFLSTTANVSSKEDKITKKKNQVHHITLLHWIIVSTPQVAQAGMGHIDIQISIGLVARKHFCRFAIRTGFTVSIQTMLSV